MLNATSNYILTDHVQALMRNTEFMHEVVTSANVDSVTLHLVTKGVLTNDDHDRIRADPVETSRRNKMLRAFQRVVVTIEHMELMMEAFQAANQKYIAQTMHRRFHAIGSIATEVTLTPNEDSGRKYRKIKSFDKHSQALGRTTWQPLFCRPRRVI